MSELQAGMLALVVGATNHPENIGKFVTVGNRGPEFIRVIFGDCFEIQGAGDCLYALRKHLLPIKPEADPLDVTHKEELHA